MEDAAKSFFGLVVEPAIQEYNEAEEALTRVLIQGGSNLDTARSLVLKRARTASIELHQFTDRELKISPSCSVSSDPSSIRIWLREHHVRRENGSPVDDVEILRDIADAFKHAELDRRITYVKSDRAVIFLSQGYGQLAFGEGKYGGIEQCIVKFVNGNYRALSSILWTVRDAWASAMGRTRWLIQ